MATYCYIARNRNGSRSIKIGGFGLAVKKKDDFFEAYNSHEHPVRWSAPELFSNLSVPITTEADKWSHTLYIDKST